MPAQSQSSRKAQRVPGQLAAGLQCALEARSWVLTSVKGRRGGRESNQVRTHLHSGGERARNFFPFFYLGCHWEKLPIVKWIFEHQSDEENSSQEHPAECPLANSDPGKQLINHHTHEDGVIGRLKELVLERNEVAPEESSNAPHIPA